MDVTHEQVGAALVEQEQGNICIVAPDGETDDEFERLTEVVNTIEKSPAALAEAMALLRRALVVILERTAHPDYDAICEDADAAVRGYYGGGGDE